MIEPVMLREIRRTGMVDLRFGHELVEIINGHENDTGSVEIKARDKASGEVYDLVAPALVAADGAASFVRDFLQVPLDGPKKVAHFINCYFRADIEKYVGEHSGILLFFSNKNATGVFQPLDAKGRWLTQLQVPEEEWSTELYTAERCAERIRAGAGVPDLEVEVLSIGKWQMNAVVGRSLIAGRILLTGDAAHMFPPTGARRQHRHAGHAQRHLEARAVSEGQGRAQIAANLRDRATPVARWVADQSYHNRQQVNKLGAISRGEAPADGMGPKEILQASRRYGNHIGLELGTIYTSDAVIPDGSAPPAVEDSYTDYVPSGHPGARAPHVWLDRQGERLSTIDLVGPEFSLIAGSKGRDWERVVADVGEKAGLALQCHVIGDELADVEGTFNERFGIGDTGAVLVRPDGFIAWRMQQLGPNAAADLGNVIARILS